MATRFYFQNTGAPSISPNPDGGWEQTGGILRRRMPLKCTLSAPTTLGDSGAITIPITTTQQILCYQFISDDIFLPVRLDASVRFSVVIRCFENANSNNAHLAYVLRAMRPDGGLSLGTLASSMTTATEMALSGSAATRIFGNGTTTVALTATTISEPWRLVLELGAHAQAPTAAGSFQLRSGCSAASDFALTSGLTTNLNPWCELSYDLNAVRMNNYHAVRVGSGMSSTDRIR